MNLETLRKIFKAPFDYKTYCTEVVKSLFDCTDAYKVPELLDTTTDGDRSHYIGQMEDAEGRLLGFFYTRVAEGSDVRRKRVGLRKLISPYLKYDVEAAIAVFDDGQHWRLSYICDMKEGTTAAKRFSYIFGDAQGQYKTPLERLERVAKQKGRFAIADLREAFSVEVLSKEFFDEYHRHYDHICKHLEGLPSLGVLGFSPAIIHDYVKKMMGRIVFLHFLQKKGWLGGNPQFLRDLFFMQPLDRQSDFLEQVLEPLFFGIFNTEASQREQLFASEGWDSLLLEQWQALPYLNGGLFERDEVDKMKITLPASLFKELFEFMASYNFTVDENAPDDAEVGVDPEMLGKIFESLLEDNKAKGVFYTPKEIVRYMCRESLIAYLGSKVPSDQIIQINQTNQNTPTPSSAIRHFVEHHELPDEPIPHRDAIGHALREVKICDPAIGSGAFPMGLLNELWRCREALSASDYSDYSDYPLSRAALKREIIENNIYGVDIERGAIDIARLRFWLSIVVDAEQPEPLPNFDYKFMQGNSLIESFAGHDLCHLLDGKVGGRKALANQYGMDFSTEETRRNLHLLLKKYFSLTNHAEKAHYRELINGSVKSYILQQGLTPTAEALLLTLDPSANQHFFLWHTWFKDIFAGGGFDIVIGNPPYIRRTELPENAKAHYERAFRSAVSQYDIYLLFIEFGISICKTNALVCFINPIRFFSSDYGKGCRQIIIKENYLRRVVDVSQIEVFKNAMTYPCVLHIQRQNLDDYIIEYLSPKDLHSISQLSTDDCNFLHKHNIVSDSTCRIIVLGDQQGVVQKVDDNSNPISTWYNVSRGLANKKVDFAGSKYRALKSTMVKKYSVTSEYKLIDTEFAASFVDKMIILPRTVLFLQATLKDKGIVLLDRIYYLKHKSSVNDYYILGVINARITNYWFEYYYSTTKVAGGYLDLNGMQIRSIPIPNATIEQQNIIAGIVDKILKEKRINLDADTTALEREIDHLVYALYRLTEEEIAIIEGNK